MRITEKYWRTARALALDTWADASIADVVLECADGTSYEPDDDVLAEAYDDAKCSEPRERPDYVSDPAEALTVDVGDGHVYLTVAGVRWEIMADDSGRGLDIKSGNTPLAIGLTGGANRIVVTPAEKVVNAR